MYIEDRVIQLADKVESAYKIAEGKNFERSELFEALLLAKEVKGFFLAYQKGRDKNEQNNT